MTRHHRDNRSTEYKKEQKEQLKYEIILFLAMISPIALGLVFGTLLMNPLISLIGTGASLVVVSSKAIHDIFISKNEEEFEEPYDFINHNSYTECKVKHLNNQPNNKLVNNKSVNNVLTKNEVIMEFLNEIELQSGLGIMETFNAEQLNILFDNLYEMFERKGKLESFYPYMMTLIRKGLAQYFSTRSFSILVFVNLLVPCDGISKDDILEVQKNICNSLKENTCSIKNSKIIQFKRK